MLNPFGPNKPISYLLYIYPFAPYHKDLKTIVLIKVYMHCRHNGGMKMVLDFCKCIRKFSSVMGIDDSNSANGLLCASFPFLFYKTISYEIGRASCRERV